MRRCLNRYRLAVVLLRINRPRLEPTERPVKDHHDLPGHIERGQQGGHAERAIHHIAQGIAPPEGIRNDFVFGEEAREEGHAGQRQVADHIGQPRHAHEAPQTTHVADILSLVRVVPDRGLHAVNNRAGAKKEQGLEKRVRQQVEQTGNPATDAKRRHHEAQLRQRRVG